MGTGGWVYFQVPGKPPLKAYSEVFDFVEVNSTFYQYLSLARVKNWRQTVPQDFVFSVRCHQDLTHVIGLRPVDEAYQVFDKMVTYCQVLQTPYLVLETSATKTFDNKAVMDARDFFSTISLDGLVLVWEYRAPYTPAVSSLMQDFGIVQSVDLSIQKPQLHSDVVYSRLFGKGKHNIWQFTDDELNQIDTRAQETQASKVLFSFHGQRMHSDALRLKKYKITGKYPPVTDYIGLDSAKAVLSEDAKFPTSKAALVADQGWKVIDLTAAKRVHLSEVLDKIPEKTYRNLGEVVSEVRAVL